MITLEQIPEPTEAAVETVKLAPFAIETSLVEHAHNLKAQIDAMVVNSDDTAALMTDIAKRAKSFGAKMEVRRKEVVGPYNDYVKNVNAKFKVITEPLDKAESTAKSKILSYQREIEAKRRAEEEVRRKAAEEEALAKAQAYADKGFDRLADMALQEGVVEPEPQAKRIVAGDNGTMNVSKVWKHRVVDVSRIPAEYLIVNDQAVRAAIRTGVRSIPGIEIYQEDQMRLS